MDKKTGEYILIRYPNSSDCNMERFNTKEELEEAIRTDYSCQPSVACKELKKILLED